MPRQLNIAGKNSNDIYTLFYPSNLMNFCRYDFSLFLEHCTDLCRLAARTGEYNVDDVYSIRNSISGCHKYYEQNMRTTFEKIVVDCWIDYLCKQSEIGVNTLWQSFLKCRNPFEKAIFGRLSDYRYNRAINEWTNLLKLQEYARVKSDFVFGVKISSPQQAVSRANYFDLLYNVAANEQGFPINEIASVGVFSAGRLPNSPFVMNTAAKEIARNQLKDIEYKDGYKFRKNPDLTDKIAMDAFAAVKEYIPAKNDSMAKTIIKSLSSVPQYIYVPGSFKAIIDLEIDVSAQSGAYLQKCARCGDYYIRDEEYDFDYCSRLQRDGGGTCLELMKIDDPELAESAVAAAIETDEDEHDRDEPKIIYVDKDTVTSKMDALYKEMAARVNVDMTQRDFSMWYQRELRLKDDILLGEAGEKQLNDFIELSRGDEFASKKRAPLFEKKEEQTESPETEEDEITENGKHIRKFVFEKVDRETVNTRVSSPAPASTLAESEKAAMDAVRKLFAADRSKTAEARQNNLQNGGFRYGQQPVQNYDPAGMQAYSYPSQYGMNTQNQPVQPVQPVNPVQSVQPQGYAAARQGYGNVNQYGQQNGYQQQTFRQPPVSRIIKGGSSQAQDIAAKSRPVVIPNGDENRSPSFVSQVKQNRDAERKGSVEGTSRTDVRTPEEIYGRRSDIAVQRQEDDVKVFIPHRSNIFASGETEDYIEPSPYEKLRQSIEEYDREKQEPAQPELDGQISAEEIVKPPAPASAAAAYRGYTASSALGTGSETAEKADFSHILEGMTRDDGFSREENLVDSDGLPVSHKTKHVMNALFGPSKASPLLRRVQLDDDDDE
ncbi:MAG: DUF1720 domain-containing protein [Ruminiclostridium sp.]|nr:DUF1720 domain-containing protein [Ruminiclostridium sp.]